jgi:hypothetical protein
MPFNCSYRNKNDAMRAGGHQMPRVCESVCDVFYLFFQKQKWEDSPVNMSDDGEKDVANVSVSKKRHRSKGNAPMYNVRAVLYASPSPTMLTLRHFAQLSHASPSSNLNLSTPTGWWLIV